MIPFSIGRKLAVGFGILMFSFILLGVVSYFQMQTVIRDIIKITDQEEPKSAAAYEMEIHAIETEISILNYLFRPTQQSRSDMERKDLAFSKAYNDYLKLAKNSEEKQQWKKIDSIHNELMPIANSLMQAKDYQQDLFIDIAENFHQINILFNEYKPESVDQKSTGKLEKLGAYISMKNSLSQTGNWLGNYLQTRNNEYAQQISAHTSEFLINLKKFESLPLTDLEKTWIKSTGERFSKIHFLTSEIVGIQYAFNQYLQKFIEQRVRLHQILQQGVITLSRDELRKAKLNGIITAERARQINIGFTITAFIFSSLVVIFLTMHVTKSFKKLVLASEKIGKGELSERINIRSKDEFGRLGESFNKMAEDLERYITEKTRVEDSLKESEKLFSDVFESIQDGIIILDKDLKVRRFNGMIKKWYADYLPLEAEICHKAFYSTQHPCEPCPAIRCIESGQTEMDIKPGLPGSPVKWVELYAFPLRNRVSGQTTGVVEFVRDITRRKQDEEDKRVAQERYRLILDHANEAIFVAQDGKIRYANPYTEKLIGYSKEELADIPFIEMVHPDDKTKMINRYNKIIEGKKTLTYSTFKAIDKSGQELLLEINSVRIDWGETPAILSFVKNITEIKKMEKQLIQSQKMESIGTLAGGIAHDFNNILFPIVGYTELSMDEVPKNSRVYENLQAIFNASMRARDLIEQILTFSRKGIQEKKPIMAQLIVKEALKLLRSSIPKTIEIHQQIDKKCGLIMGDPTQIHQIVMNLCTNAYHAMEDSGGKIKVVLSEVEFKAEDLTARVDLAPGPYLLLSVADTGKGIPHDIIGKIFDPYFTTKESGKGTGLGLSVTHGIVKNHRGSISVYSEPGIGTTFRVYLPLIEKQISIEETEESQVTERGNEHILLVDDENSILQMEQQMLERLGYHVVTRASSIEALEAFRANPDRFDLVISDLTMPNMTGDQLAKELIKIRNDIPILLCTGFSERLNEEKAKILGIKGLLMKPIIKTNMAKTVRQVLDQVKDTPLIASRSNSLFVN